MKTSGRGLVFEQCLGRVGRRLTGLREWCMPSDPGKGFGM